MAFRTPDLPELVSGESPWPTVTLGELVDAGALTMAESPPTLMATDAGSDMLTAKDIRLGRVSSKIGDPRTPGAVTAQRGDVVVAVGVPTMARVCAAEVLVGPGVMVLRGNPTVIDAVFLSGVIRAAGESAEGKQVDLFAVNFPRLPLGGQRDAGAAIGRLMDIESAWRAQRLAVERLVGAGLAGLATGTLRAQPRAADVGE